MWLVRMSIPKDKFFDAMQDVGGWLTEEHINAPHFSYSREAGGEIRFRISFDAAADADRFAERFCGRVMISDHMGD